MEASRGERRVHERRTNADKICFETIGITDDVIFVCAFDLFGENRSIYIFETVCRENPAIVLKDKRKTFFVNIYGDRRGIDANTVKLEERFEDGKKLGRAEGERLGRTEGEKLGRAEGEKLGRAEGERLRDKSLIMKWFQKGKTVSEIAEDLEKSEEYVRELMQE